jgi:excisionase family DNA binding protein
MAGQMLTVAEVAEKLQLSVGYTRRLVRLGKIPSVRIGSVRRISPITLEHYANARQPFDVDAAIAAEAERRAALTPEQTLAEGDALGQALREIGGSLR